MRKPIKAYSSRKFPVSSQLCCYVLGYTVGYTFNEVHKELGKSPNTKEFAFLSVPLCILIMEILAFQNTHHVEYQKQSNWYCDPIRSISEQQKHGTQVEFLSKKLEEDIRAAKTTHLLCGEVLLPCGLLQKVAKDILNISESELCGLRGMNLYLLYEGEDDCRRLSFVEIDPSTPSTFEVYLTFKQANAGWTFLPQFLKKITRGGSVIISTDYKLTKKRLYRSTSE